MSLPDELAEVFKKFPGVGPRQAKRFVYHILGRSKDERARLSEMIRELGETFTHCSLCHRFVEKNKVRNGMCNWCGDVGRDIATLLIVPRDIDAENIEKSGAYTGRYFILGGTIPVLDQEPEVRIRATALKNRLTSDTTVTEVIIAMNLTPEGEHTEDYIRGLIASIVESRKLSVSTLGRGMSTGTELEYSDPLTLKSALTRRMTF